ncbi:hypothetical protein D3C76_1561100 [compost metagenome]
MTEKQRIDFRRRHLCIRQGGTGDIDNQVFQGSVAKAAKARMRGGDDADRIGSHGFYPSG